MNKKQIMSKETLGALAEGVGPEVAKELLDIAEKQWWWRANHSKSTRFNTQQGYYKQLRSKSAEG